MGEHQAVEMYLDGEVAVITMDNPPVNGLNHPVRQGLVTAFEAARSDPRVKGIVLTGAGRGFSAGGDIREFGTPAATAAPALSLHVHPVIENSEKPVVAAIHGLAIGGGLETALVCHYRIAAGDTKVGLPELKLGTLPLSGTQRLPRVLGLQKAIDLILGSELCRARELADTSLFDQVIDADGAAVVAAAIAFARTHIDITPLPLIRHLPLPDADPAAVLAAARSRIGADDLMAREGLNAIAAAVESADFDAGMAVSRAIFNRLITSDYFLRQSGQFLSSR